MGTQKNSVKINPPSDLDAVGKAKWRTLCDHLEDQGNLAVVDANVIELYCRTYSVFLRAIRELEASPLTVVASNGKPTSNPLVVTIGTLNGRLKSLLTEMNLTPRRREPMHATEAERQAAAVWGDLF